VLQPPPPTLTVSGVKALLGAAVVGKHCRALEVAEGSVVGRVQMRQCSQNTRRAIGNVFDFGVMCRCPRPKSWQSDKDLGLIGGAEDGRYRNSRQRRPVLGIGQESSRQKGTHFGDNRQA
jgi:hypothetical protein